jgi:hypothetical protein
MVFKLIHIGADHHSTHAFEGDRAVKMFSPFLSGKGNKTPGLEVYSARGKASCLKDCLNVFLCYLFIDKRAAAPAVKDEIHSFLRSLFNSDLGLSGKKGTDIFNCSYHIINCLIINELMKSLRLPPPDLSGLAMTTRLNLPKPIII